MTVHYRHLLRQGPMLRALGRAAAAPLLGRLPLRRRAAPQTAIERTLPPLPAGLVADFVREVGGDPGRWRGAVPPHLFPQWGLPLAAELFAGLPYPLQRVLNAGCRLELGAPLPAGEPVRVTARLLDVDDDGRRARVRGLITTGPAGDPDALRATVEGYVPLAARRRHGKRERSMVPAGARELCRWELPRRSGLDFALLTGDFNPLHWLAPYARALGFKGPLAHGYALMARALEAVVARELDGDPRKLAALEVRFTAPLALPAAPALFAGGEPGAFFVGLRAGRRANLIGSYERRSGSGAL